MYTRILCVGLCAVWLTANARPASAQELDLVGGVEFQPLSSATRRLVEALDYIGALTEGFVELHGDRLFGEDRAMVGGFGTFMGRRWGSRDQTVCIVGQQKGRDTKQRKDRRFGMPNPEGYRKAKRLMEMAAKFGKPIITLLDTPGAFPGLEAEERGQALAIAENILAMFGLRVPVLVIVIGEGGSGGALGIGIGDRVLMMEYAYYSVISPEGCAAILWKDGARTPDAAASLRLTSADLLRFKLVDAVIPEPRGGAHRDREGAMATVRATILRELAQLRHLPVDELVRLRRTKFRYAGAIEGRFPTVS